MEWEVIRWLKDAEEALATVIESERLVVQRLQTGGSASLSSHHPRNDRWWS